MTRTESIRLDLHAYVDNLSTSAASAMGKSSKLYLIYNPKIETHTLKLLVSKIVWLSVLFSKKKKKPNNNAKSVGNHVLDKVDKNMNKNENILLLLLLLFCKKDQACKRNIPGLISNP